MPWPSLRREREDLLKSAGWRLSTSSQRMLLAARDGKRRIHVSQSESDWRGDSHERSHITTFILAVALMASAADVCAAEQSGQGRPYTGPDTLS